MCVCLCLYSPCHQVSLSQFTCICLCRRNRAGAYVDMSKGDLGRAHLLDLFRGPAISVGEPGHSVKHFCNMGCNQPDILILDF